QAEDGIRDRNVTGVQTCALPILEQRGGRHVYHSHTTPDPVCPGPTKRPGPMTKRAPCPCSPGSCAPPRAPPRSVAGCATSAAPRSEERRVGKAGGTEAGGEDVQI